MNQDFKGKIPTMGYVNLLSFTKGKNKNED